MKLIPSGNESFKTPFKKAAGTEREDRRCSRSVYQARGHRPATWLVSDRVKSNDRDVQLLEQGDSIGGWHDDGDSFYCWTEETLESQHGIWLLGALQEEFGDDLWVFLDCAGYFYTQDLWEYVGNERATDTVGDCLVAYVHVEDFEVWYFPPKLPELNPVEGCWDRLQEWFKHRLVPDLPTLKQQMLRGLPTVDEPNIWNYLCV